MTPPPLQLATRALEGLLAHAAAAAPDECCGVLLGRGDSAERYVPLRNLAPTPRTAFAFDDGEWLHAARAADARGLEVVAIAHSHVDATAEPSPTDRALGDATGWMLIVPVRDGSAGPPRAWRRHGVAWVEAAVRAVAAAPGSGSGSGRAPDDLG